MKRPKVFYVDIAAMCEVGVRAKVLVHEHPRVSIAVPPQWLTTSRVLRIIQQTNVGPVFETLHSVYAPYPLEEREEAVSEMAHRDSAL